jgi:hypothetical protein
MWKIPEPYHPGEWADEPADFYPDDDESYDDHLWDSNSDDGPLGS